MSFAFAEISPAEVAAVRDDAIMATGRSDYANQVNNVLGFPFIFRGALDVQARAINEEMKAAAAKALAALAHEDVPDAVLNAYNIQALKFGPDYIIPKPLDSRVMLWVSPAVAEAAMQSGVARKQIDIDKYREQLAERLGSGMRLRRYIINKAAAAPKRIVFPEGEEATILRAAAVICDEAIGQPILIGRPEIITRGFVHGNERDPMIEGAVDRVVASIQNPGDHISEVALLKSQIKDGVSRYLYEQTKRRPMVFPVVVEV